MKASSLLVLSLLGVGLSAQCAPLYYDDSNPLGYPNPFPWSSNGCRYQIIVPSAALGSTPFFITGLRIPSEPGQLFPRFIHYSRLEIRIGHTSLRVPGTDWDLNNPAPVTVLDGPTTIVLFANHWTDLNLPTPFSYDGTHNVCIEVIVWSAAGYPMPSDFGSSAMSLSIPRAFRYDWVRDQRQNALTGPGGGKIGILSCVTACNRAASRTFVGLGCGIHASGPMRVDNTHVIPVLGSTGQLTGHNGPANSTGVYLVGGGQGGFDLGYLGARGCPVLVSVTNPADFVTIPCSFDVIGDATRPQFDIPNAFVLCGLRLRIQVVAFWPGLNPLQIGTSNAVELVLGH